MELLSSLLAVLLQDYRNLHTNCLWKFKNGSHMHLVVLRTSWTREHQAHYKADWTCSLTSSHTLLHVSWSQNHTLHMRELISHNQHENLCTTEHTVHDDRMFIERITEHSTWRPLVRRRRSNLKQCFPVCCHGTNTTAIGQVTGGRSAIENLFRVTNCVGMYTLANTDP